MWQTWTSRWPHVEANAPPAPAPEEATAALSATITAAARIAAVEVFVERWYGPIDLVKPVPEGVPAALRRFHELAAA